MDRRGFLTLLGGAALASPAMAQTAGGVLVPVPQRIVGDRLVIENMVLRGITIRNCHIIGDGFSPGLNVHDTYVEMCSSDMHLSRCHIASSDPAVAAIRVDTTRPTEALLWK